MKEGVPRIENLVALRGTQEVARTDLDPTTATEVSLLLLLHHHLDQQLQHRQNHQLQL
jgi:hypothetical protein